MNLLNLKTKYTAHIIIHIFGTDCRQEHLHVPWHVSEITDVWL
jgi:hypothetical protein